MKDSFEEIVDAEVTQYSRAFLNALLKHTAPAGTCQPGPRTEQAIAQLWRKGQEDATL